MLSIQFKNDQPFAVLGRKCEGAILLNVTHEPLRTKKLYIKILKQKISLDASDLTFPVGKYSIPFSFSIPLVDGLLGMLPSHKRVAEAVLIRPGLFTRSIRSTALLELVTEPTEPRPQVDPKAAAPKYIPSMDSDASWADGVMFGSRMIRSINCNGHEFCTCGRSGMCDAFRLSHRMGMNDSFGMFMPMTRCHYGMNRFPYSSNTCGSSMMHDPMRMMEGPFGYTRNSFWAM